MNRYNDAGTYESNADRAELNAYERRMARRGRLLPRVCPTCKRDNTLTAYEAAHGYQCSACTRRDEGGAW